MRNLTEEEVDAISGGNIKTTANVLAIAAYGAGAVAVATRFIPGAQLLSGAATLIGMGLGALAGVAHQYAGMENGAQ